MAPPAAPPNDPLGGAPVTSVYDIPGDLYRRGRGMIDQFVGGGQAQAAPALPKPVEQMSSGEADAFVGSLTDEQLQAMPRATVQALERLLAGQGPR